MFLSRRGQLDGPVVRRGEAWGPRVVVLRPAHQEAPGEGRVAHQVIPRHDLVEEATYGTSSQTYTSLYTYDYIPYDVIFIFYDYI